MKASEIQGNSVENWATPIFNRENLSPMTREQSEMFIKVSMIDDAALQNNAELEAIRAYAIYSQRTQFAFPNLKVDNKIKLFISSILDSPGSVCMYVYIIAVGAKRIGTNNVTWNDFSTRLFPFGIQQEEVLHKFWDEQKV